MSPALVLHDLGSLELRSPWQVGDGRKAHSSTGHEWWGFRLERSTAYRLVAKSYPTACQGSSCPWDFPGKNPGVGIHFLQEISTQGSNLRLLHWESGSLPLSCQESPRAA